MYSEWLDIIKQNEGHGFLNIHCEKSYGEGRLEIGLSDRFLDK